MNIYTKGHTNTQCVGYKLYLDCVCVCVCGILVCIDGMKHRNVAWGNPFCYREENLHRMSFVVSQRKYFNSIVALACLWVLIICVRKFVIS